MKNYKTEISRLARFFKNSRDRWKNRAIEKQKQNKVKNKVIRDLKISRDKWKNKSKGYKAESDRLRKELAAFKKKQVNSDSSIDRALITHAANHSFSLATVFISVLSFVANGISLRGTSHTFSLFSHFFHNEQPSYSSIRKWVLRIGLYVLNTPVKTSGSMTWIIDHSIESGSEKLLVVLGVSDKTMAKKDTFILDFEDVTLLDVAVCPQSNGEIVCRQLEDLSERYGSPSQIITDGGSDLIKGTRLFREIQKDVIHTYDIMHKLATLLKSDLQDDEGWKEFFEASAMTAKMVRQTDLVFAAPPSLRAKARYMNADLHISWANKVLQYIDQGDYSLVSDTYELSVPVLEGFAKQFTEVEMQRAMALLGLTYVGKDCFAYSLRVAIGEQAYKGCGDEIVRLSCTGRIPFEMKYDWVADFRSELKEFNQLLWIVEAAKQEVRQNGLSQKSVVNYRASLDSGIKLTDRANGFKKKVAELLKEESSKIPNGVSLPGSSEIIESAFGKYKTFSKKRPIKTVGEMILTIPLSLQKMTIGLIKQALEVTSYQAVEDWSEKRFGKSAHSKRLSAFGKRKQFKEQVLLLICVKATPYFYSNNHLSIFEKCT